MNDKISHQNAIFKFKGSYEEYNRLLDLYESGELEKVLGVPISNLQASSIKDSANQEINLGECLQQAQENLATLKTRLKEAGYNLIQNVFEPPYIEPQLAYAYTTNRGLAIPSKGIRSTSPSIENLINRLNNAEKDEDRLLLAKELAEKSSHISKESSRQINKGRVKAIAIFIELIEQTESEQILWEAVESLSIVSPNDLPSTVMAFSENIGLSLTDYPLKLYVGFSKRNNCEISVYFRLYPQNTTDNLPEGIKLAILYDGQVFEEIINDEPETQVIMYKVIFESGDRFNVRVALDTDSITTRTYVA